MRDFQELVECLEVNNHCPKLLSRALLPEAAMEHALKAVQIDNRVRRWKGDADPQWELLYQCSKGQVDWDSPDGKLLPARCSLRPASVCSALPCYFALPCSAVSCPAPSCPALPCYNQSHACFVLILGFMSVTHVFAASVSNMHIELKCKHVSAASCTDMHAFHLAQNAL